MVAGRLVGFFGRSLCVNTAPIRRNRAKAKKSPTLAFMVLEQKMGQRMLSFRFYCTHRHVAHVTITQHVIWVLLVDQCGQLIITEKNG